LTNCIRNIKKFNELLGLSIKNSNVFIMGDIELLNKKERNMKQKIKKKISNKLFYTLLILLVILFLGLGVYAYTSILPNPGHGADKVLVSVNGQEKTLQQAIDNGDIGNKRLYFELNGQGTTSKYLELDGIYSQSIYNICSDGDGCTVTLGMKDWDTNQPGNIASRGPYKFFSGSGGGVKSWWRVSDTDWSGKKYDDSVSHIIQAFDCFFTDASLISSGNLYDRGYNFGLYYARSSYYTDNIKCILIIED